MGQQLGDKAVTKAVKCAKNTVQYWLNRWRESKDLLSDMKRSESSRACNNWKSRPTNLEACKQRQYCYHRWYTKCFEAAQNIGMSQETIRRRLKEAGTKFTLPISKPVLTENHRYDRLRWIQATCDIDWNQVIFCDEATVRLNPLKQHVWHLLGKRREE